MKNPQYSAQEILSMVNLESSTGKDVCFHIDNLRLSFGFERMDGELILLNKLIFPSKTEDQIQMLRPYELKDNFEKWCRGVGISYGYDFVTDRYFLRKIK